MGVAARERERPYEGPETAPKTHTHTHTQAQQDRENSRRSGGAGSTLTVLSGLKKKPKTNE